jgi:hypothetical protein
VAIGSNGYGGVASFTRTPEDPMTDDRLPLAELLAKAGDGDFLRSVAEAVVQLLMETDVEGLIGAGRHERTGERTTYRNGYRDRSLDTRLGSLQLRIPKLRQGSYFPPFLEPRKTSEKALVAVIQEAWDHVRQRGGIWGLLEVASDHAATVAICGGMTSAAGGANSAIGSVCM